MANLNLASGRFETAKLSSPTGAQPYRTLNVPSRSHGLRILQVFVVCLMVLPSDIVLKPVGGLGYPAAMVGLFAFAAWAAATLLGLHDPRANRHPIRVVLCLLWVTTLVSYVLMDRGLMDPHQLLGADRFLMQLVAMSGVTLIAAECLTSRRDIRRVLRVLSWAGAFCGLVAALQFWLKFDITHYLRSLPGFATNADDSAILNRGGLNRVTGTAIHPIELGVTAAMLLPLAVYSAMYDPDRRPWRRWTPVALISGSIAVSVSRSAILGTVLAIGMFIVLMPARQRLVALAAVPLALIAVFMTAHGLIGTLANFFGMGTLDPSITHRTDNYPYVEQLVRHAPWFGQGGGTYIPTTLHILDNQYLTTAITLGLVGVLAVAMLFVLPMVAALIARKHSSDPELRLLCAALASAALAATVCSATFDSLSFPMFYNLVALVIGLVGATWRLARTEWDASTRQAGASPTGPARAKPFLTTRPVHVQGG